MTATELDSTLPSPFDHTAPQRVSQARSQTEGECRYGSSGEDIERDGEYDKIPEIDEGEPGGEEQETAGTNRGNETLAPHNLGQ